MKPSRRLKPSTTGRQKQRNRLKLNRRNTLNSLPQRKKIHDRAEMQMRRTDIDFTKILGNKSYETLTYVEDDVNVTSSVDFALDTYRISNIFDPNPSLLTGGITGYQEFVAIFFKWLVSRLYADLSIINQETAKPITIGVLFNPDNLSSTILSRANAINALERPGTMVKTVMLAANNGQNRMTNLHFEVNPSTVYGNSSLYFGSVNFSGSAPAGPPQDLFMHIIIIGPAALSLSLGVLLSIKLTYDVKFFSVAPTLLALTKEEELRSLFARHKQDLALLGGSVKNVKVIQCRIDFLVKLEPYYNCIEGFSQMLAQELKKMSQYMTAIAVLKHSISQVML